VHTLVTSRTGKCATKLELAKFMVKVTIIFEENDEEIIKRQFAISEDTYPDGKRMLQDDAMWEYTDLLNEVEDIINNGSPKF